MAATDLNSVQHKPNNLYSAIALDLQAVLKLHDHLYTCLGKAESLSSLSLDEGFLTKSPTISHDCLCALNDYIQQAQLLNDQLSRHYQKLLDS